MRKRNGVSVILIVLGLRPACGLCRRKTSETTGYDHHGR